MGAINLILANGLSLIYALRNMLLVGVVYYAGAWLGASFTVTASGIAVLWPANAVLLTAFLLLPIRQWPFLALSALSAEILVSYSIFPLPAAAAFGLINLAESALVAWLILRVHNRPFAFDQVRSALHFVIAGPLLASCLAGLAGAGIYIWLGRDDSSYLSLWRLWWFGDALGLLLLTPLFVSFVRFAQKVPPQINWRQLIEYGVLLLALVVMAPWAFAPGGFEEALEFHLTPVMLLPFGIWSAIRFGVNGTVIVVMVTAVVAVQQLMMGNYVYGSDSAEHAVWLTQEYLAVFALVSVGLAILLEEMRQQSRTLEYRVRQRTDQLAQTNDALLEANERLQRLVATDFLTDIGNRRFFTDTAHKTLQRLRSDDTPASLIMFDLDNFKQINDVYGHEAGDRVLQNLVGPVKDVIRPGDLFCRFGGEEFIILLPEADLEAARQIAERIRTTLEALQPGIDGKPVMVTSSFGVAQWDGLATLDALISKADHALYRAKNAGRNRVCVSPADPAVAANKL
ncbi:MAG: diguanylate cyclase [Pseudohongiella sp.]|uniref:sensor domain-containing diguanylate cyclase n=1 Tax=Pseudohongiella sp. TaxID=1979412 RepID=UPI0034A0A8F5